MQLIYQVHASEKKQWIDVTKEEFNKERNVYRKRVVILNTPTDKYHLSGIELIKAALSIAERKGDTTNWGAFKMQCESFISNYYTTPPSHGIEAVAVPPVQVGYSREEIENMFPKNIDEL